MVIDHKRPVALSFLSTLQVRTAHRKAEYTSPEGKAVIGTDRFRVWYPHGCEADAKAAAKLLSEQQELIAKVTGLRPTQWGIIVVPEKRKDTRYVVSETGTGFFVWCYSKAEIAGGRFAKVNIHEWTENTIDHHLQLHRADRRNRFICDGLAEYAAFRHAGIGKNYAAALEALHKTNIRSVNLFKKFRSVRVRDPWGLSGFDQALEDRGFPAGYPLSFAFWHQLCEEQGHDLPLRFLRLLRQKQKRDVGAAIGILEDMTHSSDIRKRLKSADVHKAIETIGRLRVSRAGSSSNGPVLDAGTSRGIGGQLTADGRVDDTQRGAVRLRNCLGRSRGAESTHAISLDRRDNPGTMTSSENSASWRGRHGSGRARRHGEARWTDGRRLGPSVPPHSEETGMATAKEKIREVIEAQPDDASYEEIMRELAFEQMVERGLADARKGRVISNDEMKCRIRTWRE